MIITTDEQLKDLLPSLTQHHSKSWQLEAMVRNRVNGRWRWPGTEFVVDKFPDYSVLMCRPVKDSPEYIPWPHATNIVTIFAKTPETLDAVIRRDDCLDWTRPIMFLGVDTGCVHVIKKRCEELGSRDPNWKEDEYGILYLLHASHLAKSDLPEGLQFGEITENHAQQICGEWKYGTAESLPFSRYILRNRFPSSGVFTQDGRLVAYILYRFDGMMFSGFVHPDVRRLGLFQAVNYNMVEKLASSGQDVGLLTVEPFNAGSLASNAKLGAKKVDPNDYGHECYKFTPVLKF